MNTARYMDLATAVALSVSLFGAGIISADEPDSSPFEIDPTLSLGIFQEEEPSETPIMVDADGDSERENLFDVEGMEVGVSLMMVSYAGDYDSDAQAGVQISARAASPMLSKLFRVEDHGIGGFALLGFSKIDLNDTPAPPDPDGPIVHVAIGVDYHLEISTDLFLRPQIGLDYVHFVSVDDTDSGAGLLLGIQGIFRINEKFRLSLNPQVSIGDGGDTLIFITAGAALTF